LISSGKRQKQLRAYFDASLDENRLCTQSSKRVNRIYSAFSAQLLHERT